MLLTQGDLIPVEPEATTIPWTRRKSQILNFLHRGPVDFSTLVYDTNVGDISAISTYFNPERVSVQDLNSKFGQYPSSSQERNEKKEEGDMKPRLLLYPEHNQNHAKIQQTLKWVLSHHDLETGSTNGTEHLTGNCLTGQLSPPQMSPTDNNLWQVNNLSKTSFQTAESRWHMSSTSGGGDGGYRQQQFSSGSLQESSSRSLHSSTDSLNSGGAAKRPESKARASFGGKSGSGVEQQQPHSQQTPIGYPSFNMGVMEPSVMSQMEQINYRGWETFTPRNLQNQSSVWN